MGRKDDDGRIRILIAGGGTGGHLYPAIAVARELLAHPEGCDVLMAGTARGIEARILPEEGLPLATIPVSGLKGKGPLRAAAGAARLPVALAASWRLIGAHRPQVVIGVGGYASGPVLAAAVLRRKPTLIHEQNMIPGSTNRWLAPWVTEVAVSFEETRERLGGRGVVTGNPVRSGFASIAPLRVPPERKTRRLLVFGGSQGAVAINEAMAAAAPALGALPGSLAVLHQAGSYPPETLREAYRKAGVEADVRPYIREMARAMEEADLVISRAGATTVAELTAAGRGAVLIPFPGAIHDHQTLNARVLERAGAALLVPQSDLAGDAFASRLLELLADGTRLEAMGAAARKLGRPDAASRIASLALGLATGGRREAAR